MSTTPLQNPPAVPFTLAGDLPTAPTIVTLELQIAQVVKELKEWNGESESRLEEVSDSALLTAMQIAREMFDCEPRLELMVDPEAPSFPFFNILVWRDPTIDRQHWWKRENEWHDRVQPLFSGPFNFPRLLSSYEQE